MYARVAVTRDRRARFKIRIVYVVERYDTKR